MSLRGMKFNNRLIGFASPLQSWRPSGNFGNSLQRSANVMRLRSRTTDITIMKRIITCAKQNDTHFGQFLIVVEAALSGFTFCLYTVFHVSRTFFCEEGCEFFLRLHILVLLKLVLTFKIVLIMRLLHTQSKIVLDVCITILSEIWLTEVIFKLRK